MKNEPVPDAVSAIFDGLSLAPFDPFIMKRCRIEKTGLLLMASAKMTIQLILSGWVLTYLLIDPTRYGPVFIYLS